MEQDIRFKQMIAGEQAVVERLKKMGLVPDKPKQQMKTVKRMGVDFPRRNCIDLHTPCEKAIFDAIQELEKIGADETLTEALNLLIKAKDLVSDYQERT